MVDDSDDPAPDGARTRNGQSKIKYMNQLQEVANRERDEIVIDLNDVEAVSRTTTMAGCKTDGLSTRGPLQTPSTTTN